MLLNAFKDIGLAVNTGKTKYMDVGRHRRMMSNENMLVTNFYEKSVKPLSIWLLTFENYI